jgi:translation initiation factor IF-3
MSIKSTNSGYIFDDEILDKKLFLIDSDGTKHPSINTNDAIKLANEKKMSVVIVAPAKENSLAIAKVINKGKFLFDIKKKEKEKKKLMINVKEKEITIKPKIGENDLIRFINNTID